MFCRNRNSKKSASNRQISIPRKEIPIGIMPGKLMSNKCRTAFYRNMVEHCNLTILEHKASIFPHLYIALFQRIFDQYFFMKQL